MPIYSYQCKHCTHEFETVLKIADMHLPSSQPCPKCGVEGQVIKTITGAPNLGDPVRLGLRKTDAGFKEVMQKIHSNNPGSNLNIKF
jgi:putative FmdB family regulatory protein